MLGLVALGLAIRLGVAWQPVPFLLDRHPTAAFLIDDSFLSHGIARNLARGLGPSFDGRTPTDGYQPLYVVLLVPLYRLVPDDPELPIHLALSGLALLNAGCGVWLWRTLRRLGPPGGALFGLAVWMLAPGVVRLGVNGMETSLVLFFLAWALHAYLARDRLARAEGLRAHAGLGLLLGLAILSRLDAALFAVALGLDQLALAARGPGLDPLRPGARGPGLRRALPRLAALAGAALAVVGPWLAWQWAGFGRLLPISGRAVRFASLDKFDHDPPAAFYLANLGDSLAAWLDNPALPAWRAWLGRAYEQPDPWALAINGPLLLALLAVARPAGARRLGFLGLYAAGMLAAYSFWVFGEWFYPRYYYPVSYLVVGATALGVGGVFARLRAQRAARRGLALGLALLLGSGWAVQWADLLRGPADCGYLASVRWIRANAPERAVVGAFQAGALGYYLEGRVVNLDGVVDEAALDALREQAAFDYVLERDVDLIADWSWVVGLSLVENSRRTPVGLRQLARLCGDTVVYAVVRPGAATRAP